MEVYIVQPEDTLNFRTASGSAEIKNTIFARIPVKIRPQHGSTSTAYQKILCSTLQNGLSQIAGPTNVRWNEFMLLIEATSFVYPRSGPERYSVTVEVGPPDASCDDGFFSRLIRFFGGSDMFSLDISMDLQTNGVPIALFMEDKKFPREGVPKIFTKIATDFANFAKLFVASSFDGTMRASLKLSDEALSLIHRKSQPDHFSVFGQLLTNQILTDAILVGSNGIGVHCHKNILAAYSSVFQKMFEGSMQESRGTVNLPTMTECAIRAFLAYLYSCDIAQISKSCSVAVELIVAGDMYDIPKLLETVQQIILAKEDAWCSAGNAIQLNEFAKLQQCVGGNIAWEQIRDKMVAVLRKKSWEETCACEEYQELSENRKFEDEMEFCHYIINAKQ